MALYKVLHFNDSELKYLCGARKTNDVYPKRFWGCIVTNKAQRGDFHYAMKFEENGRWASWLSKDDFMKLAPFCEHVYPEKELHNKFLKDTAFRLFTICSSWATLYISIDKEVLAKKLFELHRHEKCTGRSVESVKFTIGELTSVSHNLGSEKNAITSLLYDIRKMSKEDYNNVVSMFNEMCERSEC